MYAGESQERRIFIVRRGKVVWSYDDPAGKDEISDAVMLSNGNILFAHQLGVTEQPPDQEGHLELRRSERARDSTPPSPTDAITFLHIENGDPAVIRIVSITNAREREHLQVRHLASTHGQFRHAQLTDRGTLMVTHMDLDKVSDTTSTAMSPGPFLP